jgi:glycosyltransferase involved in cell wall biosynthesis
VVSLPLTVFTPTYQRRDTLHRVYESLTTQSLPPDLFEWVVVDDGSTDGTGSLVAEWAAESPFEVRYVWQENGGKHRAWNRGISEARGELFACLDSDDECTPTALERIVAAWTDAQADAAGVMARCRTPRGSLVGAPLPEHDGGLVDYPSLVLCGGFRWEAWHIPAITEARAHPFPNGPRGNYVPESTIWHAIRRPWLVLDEPLRIYHTMEDQGRDDQISSVRSVRRSAPGLLLRHESVLANSWRLFGCARADFAKMAAHLTRFAVITGGSPAPHIRTLPDRGARFLCWAMAPVGVALAARDLVRLRQLTTDS